MTTSDTLDIDTTAKQTIELAEAGCEIVRITAPNVRAAEALQAITQRFALLQKFHWLQIFILCLMQQWRLQHVDKLINPQHADQSFIFASIRTLNMIRNLTGFIKNSRHSS